MEDPIANAGPVIPSGFMESCAHGDVDARDVLPFVKEYSPDAPPTDKPPANVDVAVVEVALKYGAPIFDHDSIPPRNEEVADDVMYSGTVVVGDRAETPNTSLPSSNVLPKLAPPVAADVMFRDEVETHCTPLPVVCRTYPFVPEALFVSYKIPFSLKFVAITFGNVEEAVVEVAVKY